MLIIIIKIIKITPVRVRVPIIASKKLGKESNTILKNSGDSLFKTAGLIYLKSMNIGIMFKLWKTSEPLRHVKTTRAV